MPGVATLDEALAFCADVCPGSGSRSTSSGAESSARWSTHCAGTAARAVLGQRFRRAGAAPHRCPGAELPRSFTLPRDRFGISKRGPLAPVVRRALAAVGASLPARLPALLRRAQRPGGDAAPLGRLARPRSRARTSSAPPSTCGPSTTRGLHSGWSRREPTVSSRTIRGSLRALRSEARLPPTVASLPASLLAGVLALCAAGRRDARTPDHHDDATFRARTHRHRRHGRRRRRLRPDPRRAAARVAGSSTTPLELHVGADARSRHPDVPRRDPDLDKRDRARADGRARHRGSARRRRSRRATSAASSPTSRSASTATAGRLEALPPQLRPLLSKEKAGRTLQQLRAVRDITTALRGGGATADPSCRRRRSSRRSRARTSAR